MYREKDCYVFVKICGQKCQVYSLTIWIHGAWKIYLETLGQHLEVSDEDIKRILMRQPQVNQQVAQTHTELFCPFILCPSDNL